MATLQFLKNWVISRSDELLAGVESFNKETDTPEVPVGFIEDELKKSARWLLRMAPRDSIFYAIKKGVAGAEITVINEDVVDGSGIIPLPSDYLRFVSLKMAGWQRSVSNYVSDTSHAYDRQKFEQSRGTIEKPIAVLIPYMEAYNNEADPVASVTPPINQALRVFPYSETIESFLYVGALAPEDMPEEFEDALVWKTVQAVMIIMRQSEQAGLAGQKVQESLQELNFGMRGEHASDVSHKRK